MAKKKAQRRQPKSVKKVAKKAARRRAAEPAAVPLEELFGSHRELIVKMKPPADRAGAPAAAGRRRRGSGRLDEILAEAGATLRGLFGPSEERLETETRSLAAATGAPQPELHTFYKVEAADDKLDELAAKLQQLEEVEAAYVKPPVFPAMILLDVEPARTARSSARAGISAPIATSLVDSQVYLESADRGGVDAKFAWQLPGGKGAGVRIIDVEGAWTFSHEDLRANSGGRIAGRTPAQGAENWENHGTCVIGEFSGAENGQGITGICPDALVRGVSFEPEGTSTAIRTAATALTAGDIILIELHQPGPRFNFQERDGQRGFIPPEFFPDVFAAVQNATQRGIIVVAAAGNGGENLDDPIYQGRFQRTQRDSGAIFVGAGAPPPGTHGRNHGPAHSRLSFSNCGSIVDVQGWGREVTTTGRSQDRAGRLVSDAHPHARSKDEVYTHQFSGTSSAAPFVVGVLACVQGVLREAARPLLTPAQARDLLRDPRNVTPQPDSQRIGGLPDLKKILQNLGFQNGGSSGDISAADGEFLRLVVGAARQNPAFRSCVQVHVCGLTGVTPVCSSDQLGVVQEVNRVLAGVGDARRAELRQFVCDNI